MVKINCPYNLASIITAVATILSKNKSTDEIDTMAVVFTQLGDTLATISQQKGLIKSKSNK